MERDRGDEDMGTRSIYGAREAKMSKNKISDMRVGSRGFTIMSISGQIRIIPMPYKNI